MTLKGLANCYVPFCEKYWPEKLIFCWQMFGKMILHKAGAMQGVCSMSMS